MTHILNSSNLQLRNKFHNSRHDNDSAHRARNGGHLINSAIYRVEALFRGHPPNYNRWETFIFTEFELAALFIQNVDVVKVKDLFSTQGMQKRQ